MPISALPFAPQLKLHLDKMMAFENGAEWHPLQNLNLGQDTRANRTQHTQAQTQDHTQKTTTHELTHTEQTSLTHTHNSRSENDVER